MALPLFVVLAAGSALSFLACAVVIFTYIKFKPLRRHPGGIVFLKTLFDLVFSGQTAVVAILLLSDGDDLRTDSNDIQAQWNSRCRWPAFISQFSALGSECCFLALAVDQWRTLTNPFTDCKHNRRLYTATTLIIAFLTGLTLSLSDGDYGLTNFGICWTRPKGKGEVNELNWAFFFIPVLVFYFIAIVITYFSFLRLRAGLSQTYEKRRQVLETGRDYVMAYCCYWLLLAVGYGLMFEESDDWLKESTQPIAITFAIVISARGLITLGLWIRSSKLFQVIREGATRTGNATLAPHLNEALKQEVVYYTTLGIGLAARQTEISRAAQRRAGTEAVPLWEECGEVVRIDIPRPEDTEQNTVGIMPSSLVASARLISRTRRATPSNGFLSKRDSTHSRGAKSAPPDSRAHHLSRAVSHASVGRQESNAVGLSGHDKPEEGDGGIGRPEVRRNHTGGSGGSGGSGISTGSGGGSGGDEEEGIAMQSRWLTEQIRHGANSNSSGSSNGATAAKFAVGDECPRQNQFEATPVETRSTALEAIAAKGEADGGFGFVEMEDFAPQIFAQIRALYGIETDSYVRSCARARHAKLSGGSSGAFFFQSHDERFVVKSMTRQECLVLCRILPTYLEHLRANPQSLLVRIYSCHCIHIYRSKIYFVVMDNIFAKAKPLHEHYDLKGSWVDRSSRVLKTQQRGRLGSLASTPSHGTMKDNDLHYRIHLSPWRAPKMAQQLSHDVNWLCSVGIMDYSLLVGVHRSAFYCNSAKDQVTALNKETGERDAAQLERLRAQECHSESPGGARRAGRGGGRRGARMSASVSGGLQRWAAGGADAPGSGTPFRGGDGGVPAEVVEGPSIYYMGLIDILQEWTWTKRLERYFKSTCLCLDKDGLSAVDPDSYALRFRKRVIDKLFWSGEETPRSPQMLRRPRRSTSDDVASV